MSDEGSIFDHACLEMSSTRTGCFAPNSTWNWKVEKLTILSLSLSVLSNHSLVFSFTTLYSPYVRLAFCFILSAILLLSLSLPLYSLYCFLFYHSVFCLPLFLRSLFNNILSLFLSPLSCLPALLYCLLFYQPLSSFSQLDIIISPLFLFASLLSIYSLFALPFSHFLFHHFLFSLFAFSFILHTTLSLSIFSRYRVYPPPQAFSYPITSRLFLSLSFSVIYSTFLSIPLCFYLLFADWPRHKRARGLHFSLPPEWSLASLAPK